MSFYNNSILLCPSAFKSDGRDSIFSPGLYDLAAVIGFVENKTDDSKGVNLFAELIDIKCIQGRMKL
jgi:hypothetical protein